MLKGELNDIFVKNVYDSYKTILKIFIVTSNLTTYFILYTFHSWTFWSKNFHEKIGLSKL
jgi:hypothetical protein